jgi:uncharacterized protein (TIGR03790 family)
MRATVTKASFAGALGLVAQLVGHAAPRAVGTAAAILAARSGTGFGPRQLAVVIDTADPLSVQIGEYYVAKRHIPPINVARVAFDDHRRVMTASRFARVKTAVDAQLPPTVQAYALTWVQPYRVDCMAITSAFAFGFSHSYCARACVPTRYSPYFDSNTRRPYDELHIRPAMSIAAESFAGAKALIDRGVRSDGTAPRGTAYLLRGRNAKRDVRAAGYADARMLVGNRIRVRVVAAPYLAGRRDVMFYFIGAEWVPGLGTNRFLPGAIADHLTSFGGELTGSSQMSSLEWLEAGATGSYGTVVEPCNFVAKFPNPALVMRYYLEGETLIESYWKSVAMPGQGIFIGEPLAAPYARGRPATHRVGERHQAFMPKR